MVVGAAQRGCAIRRGKSVRAERVFLSRAGPRMARIESHAEFVRHFDAGRLQPLQ